VLILFTSICGCHFVAETPSWPSSFWPCSNDSAQLTKTTKIIVLENLLIIKSSKKFILFFDTFNILPSVC
jgi:hypothetical protein